MTYKNHVFQLSGHSLIYLHTKFHVCPILLESHCETSLQFSHTRVTLNVNLCSKNENLKYVHRYNQIMLTGERLQWMLTSFLTSVYTWTIYISFAI